MGKGFGFQEYEPKAPFSRMWSKSFFCPLSTFDFVFKNSNKCMNLQKKKNISSIYLFAFFCFSAINLCDCVILHQSTRLQNSLHTLFYQLLFEYVKQVRNENFFRKSPTLITLRTPYLLVYSFLLFLRSYSCWRTLIVRSKWQLKNEFISFSFEPDIACSVSVIPLQCRSCSVCMSFVKLGHHNGQTAWPHDGK